MEIHHKHLMMHGKPYEVFNYGNEGWGQIDLLVCDKAFG